MLFSNKLNRRVNNIQRVIQLQNNIQFILQIVYLKMFVNYFIYKFSSINSISTKAAGLTEFRMSLDILK